MLLKVHVNVHVNLKFKSACVTKGCMVEGICRLFIMHLKFLSPSSSCHPVLQVYVALRLHIYVHVTRKLMLTSSSYQQVLQIDMLLKVHIDVHVNLKISISFISAYLCQPQVHVSLYYK